MSCRCIISLAGARKTFQKLISLLFGYFVHGSHEWSRLLGYLEVRANAPIKVRRGVVRSTWTHLDPGKWVPHGAIRRGQYCTKPMLDLSFPPSFWDLPMDFFVHCTGWTRLDLEFPCCVGPSPRRRGTHEHPARASSLHARPAPRAPRGRSAGLVDRLWSIWSRGGCQLSKWLLFLVDAYGLWMLMDAYGIHLANDHRYHYSWKFSAHKKSAKNELRVIYPSIYNHIYIYILLKFPIILSMIYPCFMAIRQVIKPSLRPRIPPPSAWKIRRSPASRTTSFPQGMGATWCNGDMMGIWYRIYQRFIWGYHGIFMEYSWNIHGIFMEYSWNIHGIYIYIYVGEYPAIMACCKIWSWFFPAKAPIWFWHFPAHHVWWHRSVRKTTLHTLW